MKIFAVLTMSSSVPHGEVIETVARVLDYAGDRVPRSRVLADLTATMTRSTRESGIIRFFCAEPEEVRAHD